MHRRNFIKTSVMGCMGAAAMTGAKASTDATPVPAYRYPRAEALGDCLSDEGYSAIRIQLGSTTHLGESIGGVITVAGAGVVRAKSYFFYEPHDTFESRALSFSTMTSAAHPKVMVVWLDKATADTELVITSNGAPVLSTSLGQLVKQPEVVVQQGTVEYRANLLGYREVGLIRASEAGIGTQGDSFKVLVFADPQGGDVNAVTQPPSARSSGLNTRMKIHNAFIEESIALANRQKQEYAFLMVVGDIVDGWGHPKDYAKMHEMLGKLNTPVLYEVGNHETKLKIDFEPGYNMEGFAEFFAAQKRINGLEKLLYSFDLGQWHFVVWPDPLRYRFWENHPHYFDWLERDLLAHKDRPTIVFNHVPIQPIGISPFNGYYCESAWIKSALAEIFAAHGNVKYVLSGHVHIPIKSSFKTGMSYKGVNYLNLPATGFRSRAFGEEDFHGRPSQGITVIDCKGSEAQLSYTALSEERFNYSPSLPVFDAQRYPSWFQDKHALPAQKQFVNGNFERQLQGWGQNYIYAEDERPSNRMEVHSKVSGSKGKALYLYARRRDYGAPGQDRLPQDINQVFQALVLSAPNPQLTFSYRIDGAQSAFDHWNGAFVWVEGYRGAIKTMETFYAINKAYVSMQGKADFCDVQLQLPSTPDTWHSARLNIAADFSTFHKGFSFKDAQPDRLVVNLGVWNINDGSSAPFAVYFKDFALGYADAPSRVGALGVSEAAREAKWWLNKEVIFTDFGGEHRIHMEPVYEGRSAKGADAT
jgi:3',5'-cyclic AMP phosphodiesterase CpdA